MKDWLSLFPQFALPSAIFNLALKGFVVGAYHTCRVCPAHLRGPPHYYVPGAKEGTPEYHPDLPKSCLACNATQLEFGEAPKNCYDSSAPVSAFDEAVTGPSVRGMIIMAVCGPLLALLMDMALSLPAVQRCLCACLEPRTRDKPHQDDPDIVAEVRPITRARGGSCAVVLAGGLGAGAAGLDTSDAHTPRRATPRRRPGSGTSVSAKTWSRREAFAKCFEPRARAASASRRVLSRTCGSASSVGKW